MQITEEKVDQLNAIIKLEIKKEDYEPKINESLQTYRKKVDLKGFRKGHAPISIVKKMYGNHVLSDTINDLLNEKVNGYIIDNNLNILGHPLPKEGQTFDLEIDKLEDFDFEYQIGLAPEFALDFLSKNPTLERVIPAVDKKILDEEIERLTKRYGKVEAVADTMKDDDMLTILFEEVNENNEVIENGITNTTPIALDMLKDVKVQKAVKNLKKEESTIIDDLVKAFEKEPNEVAKQVLNASHLTGNLPKVKATLKEVKRVIAAEINEEFLKKVYGEDTEVKNEADLRTKLQNEIEPYFEKQADQKMYNDLAEKLIENTKMEFPDTFLKRWIKLTNEKPITDEKLEEEYPAFVKNLKWSLIIKKVSKENNIDVSLDEVRQRVREQLQQQMMSYGIGQLPEAEMENFVASMMAKNDQVAQTRETLLEEKLFDYFKGQIKIADKKVSLDDFYKQDK